MLTEEERDTIRLAQTAEFEMPALSTRPAEWWYCRAVEYLQMLGLSLHSIVEGIKEAALRGDHSVIIWRVWLCGPGIIARLQAEGFALMPEPEDQVRIAWNDTIHASLYAEAKGLATPSIMLDRWEAANAPVN